MGKVLIIAEAGVNHNGDLNLAKKLIEVAADAGADYIKFQTFKADKLVTKHAKKAEYQQKNHHDDGDNQYEMLKKLELSEQDHKELIAYSDRNNIKFMSTAFDNDGIKFLNSIGLDLFKSPSGEITNYPYLKSLASLGKPIILSTGMSTMSEIGEAIDLLLQNGASKDQITVLHCNTEYPTPMEDVNLLAMLAIEEKFKIKIGYSDHTLGIEIPIAAVALGAKVIEKHFTLDRNLPGPDHLASLEPDELKKMVQGIRKIEVALGKKEKVPAPSELRNLPVVRKSIHLRNDVKKDKILEEDDLIMLRPGDGISPMKIDNIVGMKTTRALSRFHKLEWRDIN